MRNVIIMTLAALLLIAANYLNLAITMRNEAKESAVRVNRVLSETFERTEKVLNFIGRRIAIETPELDKRKIYQILARYADFNSDTSVYSWTLFDWINGDNLQVANTMFGVNQDNPRDMSDRIYSLREYESWSLLLSPPKIGTPSGMHVIPSSVQVETKKSLRAGSVAVGIRTNKLQGLAEAQISGIQRVMLVDSRSNDVVFGPETLKTATLERSFAYKKSLMIGTNLFLRRVVMDKKYPYFIFTGYDYKQFWIIVLSRSAMQFLQIILIVVLVRLGWKFSAENRR